MKSFAIDLTNFIGKTIKIYSKEYKLLAFDTQIKETGKKRIKKRITLTNRILTDKGIISNPIFVYDYSKFEVL